MTFLLKASFFSFLSLSKRLSLLKGFVLFSLVKGYSKYNIVGSNEELACLIRRKQRRVPKPWLGEASIFLVSDLYACITWYFPAPGARDTVDLISHVKNGELILENVYAPRLVLRHCSHR
jgi:hypothetical protein